MHELSIVSSVVDTVTESLAAYPGARVKDVRLRVGALASVGRESLEFCYGIATDGTALEGSKLVVHVLPVLVHCAACGADLDLGVWAWPDDPRAARATRTASFATVFTEPAPGCVSGSDVPVRG